MPPPPGTVGDGDGERAGGTEKGSRPVKLWIGGTVPPGEGLGEPAPGVVGGIGGKRLLAPSEEGEEHEAGQEDSHDDAADRHRPSISFR